MTKSKTSQFLRFLALAVVVIVVLCALGFVPTRRLAGSEGVSGMFAGCAIGLISAAFAGCLLVMLGAESPEARLQRSFFAMMARLAVVIALGSAVVLSGLFATQPVLLWMGIAYMALLPLEVRFALL